MIVIQPSSCKGNFNKTIYLSIYLSIFHTFSFMNELVSILTTSSLIGSITTIVFSITLQMTLYAVSITVKHFF